MLMRFSKCHTPNLITCSRLILLPAFVYCMLAGKMTFAFYLFVFMGLSDALDGWLAKRYEWRSRLGSFLDPLADKIMLVSAFLMFAWLGLLPLWFILIIVLRDLLIGLGYLWLWQSYGSYPNPINPSLLSKINTVLQVALALLTLAQSAMPLSVERFAVLLSASIEPIMWASVIAAVISGVMYAIHPPVPPHQCRARRARRSLSRTA